MSEYFNYMNFDFGLPFMNYFGNASFFPPVNNFNLDFNFNETPSIFSFDKPQFTFQSDNHGSGMFDFLYEERVSTKNFAAKSTNTTVSENTKIATENSIKHQEKYQSQFIKRVKDVSKKVNCDYKDLLAVMNAESGLNEKAVNSQGGATGLIQFMPKTARGLGTSTQELLQMSKIEQMDYVEKYLLKAKRSAGFLDSEKLSGGQLYALIFLPARAKQETLTTSNEKYYKCNSKTDLNGDGRITRSELDARINRFRVDESDFA